MPADPPKFDKVIDALAKHYGAPEPPVTRDPFELLLLEKCGYLCPDEKRERAFRELKKRVGTTPEKINDASIETLSEIASIGGIYADLRATRMQQAAEIAMEEPPEDVVKRDFKSARKAISRYPMIGEPGAEKILLLCGAFPALGLESNGLRVAVRLGYGEESKNYSTMYRRTRDAIDLSGWTCDRLIPAHQLLRRHGQEICRRTDPSCGICPLKKMCRYAATQP
jgi:endonuclease-3